MIQCVKDIQEGGNYFITDIAKPPKYFVLTLSVLSFFLFFFMSSFYLQILLPFLLIFQPVGIHIKITTSYNKTKENITTSSLTIEDFP